MVAVPAGRRLGLDVFAPTQETFLAHVQFQLQQFCLAEPPGAGEFFLFIFCRQEWAAGLVKLLTEDLGIPVAAFLKLGSQGRN